MSWNPYEQYDDYDIEGVAYDKGYSEGQHDAKREYEAEIQALEEEVRVLREKVEILGKDQLTLSDLARPNDN